jgi:hypothetical protein
VYGSDSQGHNGLVTRSSETPSRRRRSSRLAALLPGMLVLALAGTTGGGLTASGSTAAGPVVDLTVTAGSAPLSR